MDAALHCREPAGDAPSAVVTATVLLVRHAVHDRLGRRLRGASAIYSSPAERARQTAAPIAAASGLEALVDPALDEIDFGAWTGARFDDLADDPSWQGWNNARDAHRPPGGESMQETQHRMAAWLAAVGACHEDGTVVAVGAASCTVSTRP